MALGRLPLWVSFDLLTEEQIKEFFIATLSKDRYYIAEEDGTVWELVDDELIPAEHIVQELECR